MCILNQTTSSVPSTDYSIKSGKDTAICTVCIILFFAIFTVPMGLSNSINTMMNTAYQLLLDTAFYIMALAVVAGAISAVMTEFGVVDAINCLLSPLMQPIYGLPGAAALGIITTFLSDNPAILSLANDSSYRRHFKAYQIPALTNLGTAFGMGLIVTSFMVCITPQDGSNTLISVLCGVLGAIAGSIISTRLMLHYTKKVYGTEAAATSFLNTQDDSDIVDDVVNYESAPLRVLNAVIRGGKSGVELGIGVIPGILIICTTVMMLTNGPSSDGTYTGAAYEGIAFFPALAEKLSFIFTPLFGFSNASCIAVPITALGAAGAAIGLVPRLAVEGLVNGSDIAVFTAMCMCWSGYLSTHVSMMDILNCRSLTGKSILSHTIGGFLAGIVAHLLYMIII